MFAITPRRSDDYGLCRLLDELANPWDVQTPIMYGGASQGSLSGRLGDSEIHNTDKQFSIRLDLKHYKPEEVKITSDNEKVTISAKHEEKQDNHGFVSRQMTRTYKLPEDVDPKSVTSTMNSQGTLSIKAAKKAIEGPKDTNIPIEYTGK